MEDEIRGSDRTLRLREAEVHGCHGLVEGRAKRLRTRQDIGAHEATRADGPFVCGLCFSEVVVRKCVEKRDHFAHAAPRPLVVHAGESALHKVCKAEIRAAMASAQPDGRWEIERGIPARADEGLPAVVPDVSGRVGRHRLAIEVQASALDIATIVERTEAYARRGIHMLWVLPLAEPMSDEPFRPRLHERYVHSMAFGRAYYWWPSLGRCVVPIHFGAARHHVEASRWHERGGERIEAGGYQATYRAIKQPMAAPPPAVDIAVDFAPVWRASFTPANERKAVPGCRLWLDGRRPWW